MTDFKKSCIYQIYPKSFKDSNKDGFGDIKGITEKLDYLKELGIDYIWSTPFFLSPGKDNGYDIADYRKIDPKYGTMEDLEELIAESGKREIAIILDMVFNHTSTEHDWFQKAMDGDLYYKDFYIFKEGRAENSYPTNWKSKFGESAWEYVPRYSEYYLHLFDQTEADLNWDNPNVRAELKAIINFWREKGIKGFRFDVINLISKPVIFVDDEKGDGRNLYSDGPKIHEYLKELVRDCRLYENDILTIAELTPTSLENSILYSDPAQKELSMSFNFHHLKVDYKNQNKWEIQDCDFESLKNILHQWQVGTEKGNGWNTYFWCNHDQPRIVSRFGDDKNYHRESAKMLATMIHLLRGTPCIYQGEEIGMTNAYFEDKSEYRDEESLEYFNILQGEGRSKMAIYHVLKERSRDNARTPMQWDHSQYAGFSETTPWISLAANYKEINVENSFRDENSILSYYKKLIELRKKYDVISYGAYQPLLESHKSVFAYERRYQEHSLIVLCNFYGKETRVNLEGISLEGMKCLISNYGSRLLEYEMILKPYEAVVFIDLTVIM